MAPTCSTGAQTFNSAQRPQGSGGSHQSARASVNPTMEKIFAEQAARRAKAQAAGWTYRAQAVMGNAAPGTRTTAAQQATLRAAAGQEIRRLTQLAAQGMAAASERTAYFMRGLSGATVNDASAFFNITNSMAKVFVKSSAQFDKWAILLNGGDGRSVKDNIAIQAQEQVRARVAGKNQIFRNFFINRVLKPIHVAAKQRGMDDVEFGETIGFYSLAQHTAEGNADLINRAWPKAKAEALAKGDTIEAVRIQKLIDDLSANLDNPFKPETLASSTGMTNAEAVQMMADIEKHLGITRAEAEGFAQNLRDFQQTILADRLAEGSVTPAMIAEWPQFNFYVPTVSLKEATTGALNDANLFGPGKYHRRDGRTTLADTPWHTLQQYGRRAAHEAGVQDLAAALYGAKENAKKQGRDVGIRAYKYSEVMQAQFHGSPERMKRANDLLDHDTGAGIVYNKPVHDAAGNIVGFQKLLLTFDQNWYDPRTGISGISMNKAIAGTLRSEHSFGKLAQLTSYYGQLNTRFNPIFAPVNSWRDVMERGFHLIARDYRLADGSWVSGASLTGRYAMNVPQATQTMIMWRLGKLDMNSKQGQLVQMYVASGLHQEYTRGMNQPRQSLETMMQPKGFIASKLDTPEMRGVKQMLGNLDESTRAQAMRLLDSSNDAFNNIASFAHFQTLIEAGVDRRAAVSGVLELMDLYTQGTITSKLSAVFPYVKPTAMTGRALARTLGLAPNAQGKFQMNTRGLMAVAGATAGITALIPMLREQMGEDDDGNSRLDGIAMGELQRYLPLGLGDGKYAKMYLGFGPARLAATLAFGGDRLRRGLIDSETFTRELLFAVAKEVSPTDWPEFSIREKPMQWLEQAFAPAIFKPVLDVMANTNWMGSPITYGSSGNTALAHAGRLSTPAFYHQFAEDVMKATGVDMAPEQWRNLMDGYFIGPLRVAKNVILGEQVERAGGAEKSYAESEPWLAAFGATMLFSKTHNISRNMFYDELDRYNRLARLAGADLTSDVYGNNAQKKKQYQTNVLLDAGFDHDDIAEYLKLRDADTELKNINKNWKKNVLPERWFAEENTGLMEADFQELAILRGEIYRKAVDGLRRYEGMRW